MNLSVTHLSYRHTIAQTLQPRTGSSICSRETGATSSLEVTPGMLRIVSFNATGAFRRGCENTWLSRPYLQFDHAPMLESLTLQPGTSGGRTSRCRTESFPIRCFR